MASGRDTIQVRGKEVDGGIVRDEGGRDTIQVRGKISIIHHRAFTQVADLEYKAH